MALVVEDGSVVDGANSFVNLAFIRAYAAESGENVEADDDKLSGQAVNAFRYINAREERMQGERVSADQNGCFPRECVTLYGKFAVASNDIPKLLKQAQAQLCIEQFKGVDIEPTTTEAALKSKKVGPLAWEWDTASVSSGPNMPKVDALLAPLFKSEGFAFKTMRA